MDYRFLYIAQYICQDVKRVGSHWPTQQPVLPKFRNHLLGAKSSSRSRAQGRLGGTAVKRQPLAQGVIPALWDRAPHQAPLYEPASSSPTPPACVPSLAGCLYLC